MLQLASAHVQLNLRKEILNVLEPELLRGVPLHIALSKCGSYWEIPEPGTWWREVRYPTDVCWGI